MADALLQSIMGRTAHAGVGSATNATLSATDAGTGCVFQAYNADPITHVGFRYGVRTGTPPTYIASLQGVTTAGVPDGTVKGGGTPASVTFTPPADTSINNTWQWYALDNSYAPARGEFLAACIEYSTGSCDTFNNSSFTRAMTNFGLNGGFTYACLKTGGTWAKSNGTVFGYRTASGRFGWIGTGAYNTNQSTSGNRSTMHFTLPSGHGSTFRVLGLMALVRNGASAADLKMGLWNAAGTALQEVTLDCDRCSGVSGDFIAELLFDETSLSDLSFGTTYYIGFESVSSSTAGVRGIQLGSADDRAAYPNGTNRGIATWNGSAWTEDNTVMPLCSLILDDITVAAGGGGVVGVIGE